MAVAQPIAPPVATAGPDVIGGPTLKISGLGFDNGLVFDGLFGRQTLFFSLPPGIDAEGARLLLPYTSYASGPVRRVVTVSSGQRVLGQFALADSGTLDIPIPADAVTGGSVPVTLAYSAGSSPNRCFDARISGDRVVFAPSGGLAVQMPADAPLSVGAAASLMPRAPTIVVPARPNAEQAAAALSVIAARGGGTIVAGGAGDVQVVGADRPALTAGRNGAGATLAIGGRDPAAAARAAFGSDSRLLAGPTIDRLALRRNRADTLDFGALGADLGQRALAAQGEWSFAVPASRLPSGKEIAGLTVDVAGMPSAPGDTVTVALNGTVLGGAPLSPRGRTRVSVEAPAGSTHAINGVSVAIARARGDSCDAEPRTWPAQLLPTSEVRVREAGPLRDFSGFAARTHDGVTVVMAGPQQLPLAAKLVAGLVGQGVPIRVSYGSVPADGPAIVISATTPAGMTPALALRDGRMVLTAAQGEVDFDLPGAADATIAQLGEADGRPLLWVKPGAVTPASLWLDQGDVAIVPANGAVQSLSTTRPSLNQVGLAPVQISTPRLTWFVLGGLLLGLLVVVWSLLPSQKKRRPGAPEEQE